MIMETTTQSPHYYCMLILIMVICVDEAFSIQWLALRKAGFQWSNNSGSACRKARQHYGLVKRQAKVCRNMVEVMPHVVRAASQAVYTCQNLFSDRRWNCSSVEKAPHFTADLTTGTREQAYVYALSSAAVVYSIARACASGVLFHCSCASLPRYPPNGNFKWGGCGDNVRWATRFGKQFTDAAEKKRGARKNLATRASNAKKVNGKTRSMMEVNLHNNRAGRKAVEESLGQQCKCHGVSGSCNIRTCWRALPRFIEIGERLKRKFSLATEVVNRRIGAGRRLLPATHAMGLYNDDDLIYITKSPDYCLRDMRVGSYGTKGRLCNATSQGYDSCEDMCCGRGYQTLAIEKLERCQCKYYWCCYVKCKTCRRWVEIHECN